MAALGRILQILGWLWVIVGFAGTFFGFLSLSFFPGIILVFVARILRNQAERQEMPELESQEAEQPAPSPPERMMNTERQRQESRTTPEPAVIEPEPEREPRRKNQLLEQIVIAGREAATDEAVADRDVEVEGVEAAVARRPMSSAEMIARAHERWDSKPR